MFYNTCFIYRGYCEHKHRKHHLNVIWHSQLNVEAISFELQLAVERLYLDMMAQDPTITFCKRKFWRTLLIAPDWGQSGQSSKIKLSTISKWVTVYPLFENLQMIATAILLIGTFLLRSLFENAWRLYSQVKIQHPTKLQSLKMTS